MQKHNCKEIPDMEDSDIIALYFACAESAVSETVKEIRRVSERSGL